MRISDWSSDVCYSDLSSMAPIETVPLPAKSTIVFAPGGKHVMLFGVNPSVKPGATIPLTLTFTGSPRIEVDAVVVAAGDPARSEEHTPELQSLMRISYAVFCLKKKTQKKNTKLTPT